MVDIRTLPFPEALAYLREHGEPADPRGDIDTASLRQRFPHLGGVQLTELQIETPTGVQPARAYRDRAAVPSGRALVWVHGGAFIGGYLDMPESNWVALELASRGIPVLAVDYTKCLGDVHFDVQSDDVLAAWSFANDRAQDLLGVDPDTLLLGGASAGGALTSALVARLRDGVHEHGVDEHGVQRAERAVPLPAGLVLVYPVAHPDGGRPGMLPDLETPLGRIALNYAGDERAFADQHAFAGVGPVAGFPPTLIVVSELDGLRPSGEAFAAQLDDAGVSVRLRVELGADHAHINEPSDPTAIRTIDAIAEWAAAIL